MNHLTLLDKPNRDGNQLCDLKMEADWNDAIECSVTNFLMQTYVPNQIISYETKRLEPTAQLETQVIYLSIDQ
jgi:IS30 family transposase